ncbi:MAG: hypothetical protein V9E83_10840 [Baekduia sp.]
MPRNLPQVTLATAIAILAVAGADAPASAPPACTPHVDRNHVVRAKGAKGFVKSTKGGARELVVRGVGPTGARQAIDDETGCDVDLDRFEHGFRTSPRELHARMGRVAVRVTSFDYDAASGTLRTKGRIEHARAAQAAQMVNSTEIVYASTFIPFDSSF